MKKPFSLGKLIYVGMIASSLALAQSAEAQTSPSTNDSWFGRIEYLYVDVPKDSSTGGTTVDGGSGNHTVRLGVNHKF